MGKVKETFNEGVSRIGKRRAERGAPSEGIVWKGIEVRGKVDVGTKEVCDRRLDAVAEDGALCLWVGKACTDGINVILKGLGFGVKEGGSKGGTTNGLAEETDARDQLGTRL